jgi:ATP-binding cassette, subfamily B, bacterial
MSISSVNPTVSSPISAPVDSPRNSNRNSNSEFRVANEVQYDHSSALRWILSHLFRYKHLLASFLVAAIVASALYSSVPRLTGLAFNEVLEANPDPRRLLNLALLILGFTLVRGLFDIVNAFSIETLGQRLERDARDELYVSLLGKSQTFHNRQRVGDIMARATGDVRQLNPMMNPGVSLITESLMSIITPLVFIATIRLDLLITPLIFLVVLGFALRHYMKQLTPVSDAQRFHYGELNAVLNETISGIEVVKSTVQEAFEKRKFLQNSQRYRDSFVEQGIIQARYLPVLFFSIVMTAAFGHGIWLLSRNELSVGELVAYMGLMGVLRFPTFISIFTFSLVQLGLAGAERILELMRQETELDENLEGYAGEIKGELVFDHVSFNYGDVTVLRDISFQAKPGETIAIVGQTGSGKSTLTKLVSRTYDVASGSITIDGVDLRAWDLAALRSQISTIEQDIFLFSRSVAGNIAFGLGQRATQENIERAAHDAQANDFIISFKDGYETMVGERGVTLSGGQRQRLAIARALLTDPRILIIDDSTSAIDSATEDKIQQAINRVLEGRTTLLITHRLSQIRRADKILVLDKGEIVDQGTHAELLTRCALYRRIFARYE